MNLWILRPIKELEDNDSPWDPWYDKAFGFVIRAGDEMKARELAHDKAGDENRKNSPWLDGKYTTCEMLLPEGNVEIIIRDFASA